MAACSIFFYPLAFLSCPFPVFMKHEPVRKMKCHEGSTAGMAQNPTKPDLMCCFAIPSTLYLQSPRVPFNMYHYVYITWDPFNSSDKGLQTLSHQRDTKRPGTLSKP